jgi:hypothetical protein
MLRDLEVPLYVRHERLVGQYRELALEHENLDAKCTSLRRQRENLQTQVERLRIQNADLLMQYQVIAGGRAWRLARAYGLFKRRATAAARWLTPLHARGDDDKPAGGDHMR